MMDCVPISRLQRKDILQLKDTFGITVDEAENVLKYYSGNMEDAVQFLTNQLKPFSADTYSAVAYGPENRRGACYLMKLVIKPLRVGCYVGLILETVHVLRNELTVGGDNILLKAAMLALIIYKGL